MTKNKKLTRAKFSLIIGVFMTLLPLITGSCSHAITCQNETILHAESLIWTYPDSSRLILEGMDTVFLSERDRMYRDLVYEHALQRLNIVRSPNPELLQIIDYFHRQKNPKYECLAHYVYGIECIYTYSDEAISHLKQAESSISYLGDNSLLAGLIYFAEGYTSETEQLFHIANDYYRKALPYIEASKDTNRLALCYRDIARTDLSDDEGTVISYYEQAEKYALECKDTLLYSDIRLQKLSNILPMDSDAVLMLSQYLADTFQLSQYATFAAEYWLYHNDTTKFLHYLHVLERDTATFIWYKQHYNELSAQYLAYKNNYKEAYTGITNVYKDLYYQIQADAKIRTYAIARRYDLEREQEKTLRLTIQRQRLWITIAVIALILTIIVGSAAWVIMRQKHKEERLRHEQAEAATREEAQKEHIRHLQDELTERQQHLQKRFMERVQFLCTLKKETEIYHRDLPKWLNEVLDAKRLTNKGEWKHFERDFNDTYNDIMDEIRNKHPRLTDEDCRYLMLHMTGLDNESIGVLLQLEPRTLWNRKQKVKNRLGTEDLDRWIKENLLQFEKRG